MTVSALMLLNRNVLPMAIVLVLRLYAGTCAEAAGGACATITVSATDSATIACAPTHALLTTRVRMVRFVMLNSCV